MPHLFGSFVAPRKFEDTADAVAEFVRQRIPANRDAMRDVGSGAYGAISGFKAPALSSFVVKGFNSRDPAYVPEVIRIMEAAKQDPNDSLSRYLVWSYDFKQADGAERVIMESLVPWDDALDHFNRSLDGRALFGSFQAWLKACLRELEAHDLYAPDLKAQNMAWHESSGMPPQFRLIDTDGIITSSSFKGFQSTYVQFLNDDHLKKKLAAKHFKGKQSWKRFLKAVHAYIFEMMSLEARRYLLYKTSRDFTNEKYINAIRVAQKQFISVLLGVICAQFDEDLFFFLEIWEPLSLFWASQEDTSSAYFGRHFDAHAVSLTVCDDGLKVVVPKQGAGPSSLSAIWHLFSGK